MASLNPMRCISIRNNKYRVSLRKCFAEFELDDLATAQAFRDNIEKQYASKPRGHNYNKLLSLCVGRKPMCTITGVTYRADRRTYTAKWSRNDETDATSSPVRTAEFSVGLYGHATAKALAVAARLAGTEGRDYVTPRHMKELRRRFLVNRPSWLFYEFGMNNGKPSFFYAFYDPIDGNAIKMAVGEGENEYVLEALTELRKKYAARPGKAVTATRVCLTKSLNIGAVL